MKPLKLKIENFQCHELTEIDFENFNSALIVGKLENNDLYSNGVGKSTIFKAIEYVLFGQTDCSLDKIVRENTEEAKVTFEFQLNNELYKVTRARSKKGSSDLSLFKMEDCWKDISGRRQSDTEKDLNSLIKMNFKSFRNTIHFAQNDFTGLSTTTPEKRKTILKEVLNLAAYSKLEKIAKDKYSALSKDLEKQKIIAETLFTDKKKIIGITNQCLILEQIISNKTYKLKEKENVIQIEKSSLQELEAQYLKLESTFSSSQNDQKKYSSEISSLEVKINDYKRKISNIKINKISSILLENENKLAKLNGGISTFKLEEELLSLKLAEDKNNFLISSLKSEIEELKIPLPKDNLCKSCRQHLSPEHKENCSKLLNQQILEKEEAIKILKAKIFPTLDIIKQIAEIKSKNNEYNILANEITNQRAELYHQKKLYSEYENSLFSHEQSLTVAKSKLLQANIDLEKSSLEESKKLKEKIENVKKQIKELELNFNNYKKQLDGFTENKSIKFHELKIIHQNNKKHKEIVSLISEKDNLYKTYPLVLEAFSSTGIPNVIIQNVLDDLQNESNTLLNQLKPGLQLEFIIEKTSKKEIQDTLDISYSINGATREYEQLSGAMKLAVSFALKLGLSFLLQKMMGVNFQLLLLDEIDQCLDKASVDSFSNIIKFFQREYKILVITHNDRLKDKFEDIILVEQNIDMISKGKLLKN